MTPWFFFQENTLLTCIYSFIVVQRGNIRGCVTQFMKERKGKEGGKEGKRKGERRGEGRGKERKGKRKGEREKGERGRGKGSG